VQADALPVLKNGAFLVAKELSAEYGDGMVARNQSNVIFLQRDGRDCRLAPIRNICNRSRRPCLLNTTGCDRAKGESAGRKVQVLFAVPRVLPRSTMKQFPD